MTDYQMKLIQERFARILRDVGIGDCDVVNLMAGEMAVSAKAAKAKLCSELTLTPAWYEGEGGIEC